ncbi:MAG: hypothetical protein WCY27_02565 [archaeon]|nr:hypothetical protein [archaeon]MDD2478113.1 hypothetical protein [Candidatus ainarchaeum sp.]MDD3084805.1 hypothetical protein [Candidatus ainarchaeum sp.]MDD4221365.1 hypothetical protein [Candidatus ainarchaeum sp.]MDD4662659.1 hypothetical protein [Candidatus ainarchaeum sp.]
MDVVEKLSELISLSREIYSDLREPLYTQKKENLIKILTKTKEDLDLLANKTLDIGKISLIQYFSEINSKKLDLFSQNFQIISTRINKHLFLEINKTEIKNDLVNIKEAITRPQIYYDLEANIKNELNIFIDYLENSKKVISSKYMDIGAKKKSAEELLLLLEHKEKKIHELLKKINDYKWLEAKEKAKDSLISNLEIELIKKTKASEQNSTLLKMHIIKIESEISEMYRNIKKLNNDISHLDNSYLEKEKISLELIKELKDELLATRYALVKMSEKKESEKNE